MRFAAARHRRRGRALTPAILAVTVVALVLSPLLHLIARGLADPDSLARIFADRTSWELLGRSLLLALLVGATSMFIGTALAWLTVRGPGSSAFRGSFTIALCLALAVPSYVVAFGAIAAMGSQGIIGRALPMTIHVRDHPLLASWLVITCCTIPYVLLSVRAGLKRECGCLEEAALSLGASGFNAFRRVTLPRIMPSVLWGGILAALYSIADFGAVSLLGYRTLTWGIYNRYEIAFGLDEARGLSLMLAIVAVVLILLMRFVRPELTASSAATPINPKPAQLSPRTAPLYALAIIPLGIGVVLPVLASIDWMRRSDDAAALLSAMSQPAVSTLTLAIASAFIVTVLALPLATLHLGRVRRSGRVLTPLTLLGFGIPGVVIAIAAVGLALSVDVWLERLLDLPMQNRLYQSHLLLMLAYAALFLPEAVGPLRSSATRIHPEQLDAASMMGGSSFEAWRRISLPQLAPGIAAAAALVFITTAKELPATLILAPLNTHTLATSLWSAMSEAYFAQAAAAALMLIAIAAVGLAAVFAIERRAERSQGSEFRLTHPPPAQRDTRRHLPRR